MDFVPDSETQKSMILVVRNCLTSNTRTVPQEAIFSKLQQRRVDFALSLLQRLVEVDASGQEVRGLLEVVWDAMRARGTTYENALIHDDTEYYRGLLNILFLALQFHVAGSSSRAPDPVNKRPELSSDLSIILEIVKVVIAQGFRSLTTYLHDEPQKCSPKDFAILTAILQTALRVKNAERLYEHIVYHIEDNDTARYATTLYSWADQLTVEGDPVYGELSIIFLVELSAIPMLAEYLAVEAVLMKLSTSRLTRVLGQPKGCGPFDPVPRLYAIWTDGFLPLCLNLLFHVNRAAPEVAAFLNQFEGQLNRAAESFAGVHAPVSGNENAKKVSLSMASEAYSLSLISFILQRYREAGPSAGVDSHAIQDLKWEKSQIKEDIEELLGRRSSLRTRIVATNEKELELARQKPANSALGAENRLEEKIVQELQAALTCLSGGEDPE
jgi:nuclear pore complex protein Nup188